MAYTLKHVIIVLLKKQVIKKLYTLQTLSLYCDKFDVTSHTMSCSKTLFKIDLTVKLLEQYNI